MVFLKGLLLLPALAGWHELILTVFAQYSLEHLVLGGLLSGQ